MMEAARTSETLVNFCQTTRRYNPEDSHLLTTAVGYICNLRKSYNKNKKKTLVGADPSDNISRPAVVWIVAFQLGEF
jgi:hypothetical protein